MWSDIVWRPVSCRVQCSNMCSIICESLSPSQRRGIITPTPQLTPHTIQESDLYHRPPPWIWLWKCDHMRSPSYSLMENLQTPLVSFIFQKKLKYFQHCMDKLSQCNELNLERNYKLSPVHKPTCCFSWHAPAFSLRCCLVTCLCLHLLHITWYNFKSLFLSLLKNIYA